jgi:quinol monooxygenase YgiN
MRHVLCRLFFTQDDTKRQVGWGINEKNTILVLLKCSHIVGIFIGFYLVKLYPRHWIYGPVSNKRRVRSTSEEKMTCMVVFTFEVAKENQVAYLETTREVIKPFWEANECLSYEVFQDYFTSPERFVKIQYYRDKETMERSLALARQDPKGQEIVGMFMQHIKPDTLEQRRVVPLIDKAGTVE